MTLRQHLRGRRLLVLSLLFALPSVLAAVVSLLSHYPPPVEELKFALVFNLIPHALAPLAALLYAAGIIQDEVEEQTLTYLLVRPLPRWAIYIVKLLATLLIDLAVDGRVHRGHVRGHCPDRRASRSRGTDRRRR